MKTKSVGLALQVLIKQPPRFQQQLGGQQVGRRRGHRKNQVAAGGGSEKLMRFPRHGQHGKQAIGGGISADIVADLILDAYQLPQRAIVQEIVITPTRQRY